MPKIQKTKVVWVAWGNTDRTEGRGCQLPLAVCDSEMTALRLGKGKSVQGSDCIIKEHTAVLIDNQWLAPAHITKETKEDKIERERLEIKKAAMAKAKAAGLSDKEIDALRQGD